MDNPTVRAYYPLKLVDAIYCDGVIVSKDKHMGTIDQFPVSVISMPAVVKPTDMSDPVIRSKVERILYIAAENDADTLILGAWGCGVFGNDPKVIAETFSSFLNGKFKGVFREVVFAVPGEKSKNFIEFAKVFDIGGGPRPDAFKFLDLG
jgi:uncharacterized protein (TIGR02452 family)